MSDLKILPKASNAFHVELSNGKVIEFHEGSPGELTFLNRKEKLVVSKIDLTTFEKVEVHKSNNALTITVVKA